MKKIIYIITVIVVTFVSCNKNENNIDETLTKINPEASYAKTEYNLNMRDFAMAVNEVINTNKSFRKLVKEEALKKFDGDYDILLSNIVGKQVSHNDVDNGINTPNKIKANFTVRDLLEDAFYTLKEKNKLQSVKAKQMIKSSNSRQNVSAVQSTLIDELIVQYPDLQISVPFHEEDLEDDNYIPPVVFLPEEYDEKETVYLPAIRDGEIFIQDAQLIPDSAFLVIDRNERLPVTYENVTPPTPLSFSGIINDFGISLSWTMPAETDETNTTGYKIYRKTNNEDYCLIYTNISPYNRSYIDNNINLNNTYYYYIVSYNGYQKSSAIYSNNGQGIVAATRPASVSNFEVSPIAPNTVKFRWYFGDSNNNGQINIYQRAYYTESYVSPFYTKTLPVNGDECTSYNVPAGSQLEYKVERTTPSGTSAPKYDILYMPYRDVSKKSSVYIKRLKHSDVSKIESWRGAPEYVIKGWRVKKDGTNSTVVEEFSTRIDCHAKQGGKNDTWETVNKLVMSDWQPGFDGATWYDKISFYIIELDDDGDLLANVATSAQSAQKILTEWGKTSSSDETNTNGSKVSPSKIAPAVVSAIVVSAVEIVGQIVKWVKNDDDRIGFVYLDYYEKPQKTATIVAEAGGDFTIEFDDK